MTVTCILLFIGAMGKSAQFPLHVWLPDSMEGPTPISALIHAATMVTAGVFLVCRCSPLFADLAGLPPAIVLTAECDPIRDWGERYAARLRDAHVQTTVTRYPGIYHGFLMRSEATARGRLAIAEAGSLLRAKFAHPLDF
mgnify:CR=1 FL=1